VSLDPLEIIQICWFDLL